MKLTKFWICFVDDGVCRRKRWVAFAQVLDWLCRRWRQVGPGTAFWLPRTARLALERRFRRPERPRRQFRKSKYSPKFSRNRPGAQLPLETSCHWSPAGIGAQLPLEISCLWSPVGLETTVLAKTRRKDDLTEDAIGAQLALEPSCHWRLAAFGAQLALKPPF